MEISYAKQYDTSGMTSEEIQADFIDSAMESAIKPALATLGLVFSDSEITLDKENREYTARYSFSFGSETMRLYIDFEKNGTSLNHIAVRIGICDILDEKICNNFIREIININNTNNGITTRNLSGTNSILQLHWQIDGIKGLFIMFTNLYANACFGFAEDINGNKFIVVVSNCYDSSDKLVYFYDDAGHSTYYLPSFNTSKTPGASPSAADFPRCSIPDKALFYNVYFGGIRGTETYNFLAKNNYAIGNQALSSDTCGYIVIVNGEKYYHLCHRCFIKEI